MNKKWVVLEEPPQTFYDDFPELPKTVASLLYHRGIRTQREIDEFLHPDYSEDIHDPFLFQDMQKAVDRIFSAMENNERIIIHGDYDADGVSASVILTNMFEAFGYTNIDVFLPHRETDGYGLNTNTIDLLAKEDAKLIISCDCGISNAPEVAHAKKLGIDVIITDHHSIPESLPDAHAIIHPKIESETYPDQTLAGGGVAFKLMQGVLHTHAKNHDTLPNGMRHEALEKWSLDMVAIASVADMVPLLGESRTLTKYGLVVLNKTRRVGLQKLLHEARLLNDDGSNKRTIDAHTIGFRIAPRINAAGRMNHANVAYKLLVANEPTKAVDLAYELDQNNVERQKLTETLCKEAVEQVEARQKDAPFLFIYATGWPTGIVGLIASRMKEKYQKPTIVMTFRNGEITGSGRSIRGFNMIGAMQSVPDFFTKFGGHPMACGFTLTSADVREEFQKALTDIFETQTKELDVTPTLDIDAEITLEEVNWDLYDVLGKFEPFGQANPQPKYVARGVTVVSAEPLGKDKNHIKLLAKHKTPKIKKIVGWRFCKDDENGANWCAQLKPNDVIDIVFEIGVNEWNGNRELQLTLVDIQKQT